MCSYERDSSSVVVVKLGGSVLSSEQAYARAAEFLCRRLVAAPAERIVAVVSAQQGVTDALERTSREILRTAGDRALHLLWSTGEIRSVALLALHLQARGIAAAALNVHETGLRLDAHEAGATEASLHYSRLHAELAIHRVAVVPGFLATDAHGRIVALGRGGSDLTAVLLANGLGAARCELVKDVPGYFSADPHRDAAARHLSALTFEGALRMADHGCDLVQRRALEIAAEAGLPIVVRAMEESARSSTVSRAAAGDRCAEADDSQETSVATLAVSEA